MIFQTTFQSSENQFQTAFASPTSTFAITFGSVVGVAAEVYKGEYTVTPSVTDQLLLTKEKMLKDNMTFMAVPKQIVDNPSGGQDCNYRRLKMADTKYNSKIIFYGETLMDLTSDTVDAASLLKGKTAHDKTGAPITGTCPYDADTSDATATAAEILNGKTAYVDGAKVTGSMPNKGAVSLSIVDKSPVAIPAGYHDGSGSATIDSTEAAKIIAGNIKSGVSILGVTGDYAGELTKGQKKTVTPAKAQFSVLPDDGYDFLSEVVVNGVPIAYADNPAGGQTVTIGA